MGLVRQLHVTQVVLVRLKVSCWCVSGYGTRKRCTCVCCAGVRAWACGLADLHLHHLHLRLLHGLRLRHHGLPHHHGLRHHRWHAVAGESATLAVARRGAGVDKQRPSAYANSRARFVHF